MSHPTSANGIIVLINPLRLDIAVEVYRILFKLKMFLNFMIYPKIYL